MADEIIKEELIADDEVIVEDNGNTLSDEDINNIVDIINGAIDTAEVVKETVATDKQKWYKSWAVWSSLVGLIVLVFSIFGVWEKIGITATAFESLISAVASILVAFGIVNNPNAKGELGYK